MRILLGSEVADRIGKNTISIRNEEMSDQDNPDEDRSRDQWIVREEEGFYEENYRGTKFILLLFLCKPNDSQKITFIVN